MIWQLSKIVVALLLSAAIASLTAHRDPKYNFPPATKLIKYTIRGNTVHQIKRGLRTHGPKDQFGFKRYGLTRWLIKWDVDEVTKRVTVRYGIRVILPVLEANSKTDKKIIQKWNRFIYAVIIHEQQHAKRAFKTARDIKLRLSRMIKNHPKTSKIELNQAAYKLIRLNQAWDLEFDRTTTHGKSEGVFLKENQIF